MNDITANADAAAGAALIELPHASGAAPAAGRLLSGLEALQGVKVTVAVIAGEAEMTVKELMELQDGQVIRLLPQLDEPFDICLEGQVIARGELVAVDEHFGVRIIDLPRLA
jgi:flagellar motor switch protein FliN